MNFEVSGGKVYKEPGCESLGSNWERIESNRDWQSTILPAAEVATGKELKASLASSFGTLPMKVATGKELKVAGASPGLAVYSASSNWERIESQPTGAEKRTLRPCSSSNWERIESYNLKPFWNRIH